MFSLRVLAVLVLVIDVVEVSAGSAYSSEQQKYLLDEHNKYRKEAGAADMNMLEPHDLLAQSAQASADNCLYEHNFQPVDGLTDYDDFNYGQNIYFHSDEHRLDMIVASWNSEKAHYNYDDRTCDTGRICGHYTQVVWGPTKHVGCGFKHCTGNTIKIGTRTLNGYLVFCNYGPGGNIVGMDPFKKGAACAKCSSGKFWCTDGLCDTKCLAQSSDCVCGSEPCPSGGTKTESCECECGPHKLPCLENCEDSSGCDDEDACDPELVGVAYASQFRTQCPKLCGRC